MAKYLGNINQVNYSARYNWRKPIPNPCLHIHTHCRGMFSPMRGKNNVCAHMLRPIYYDAIWIKILLDFRTWPDFGFHHQTVFKIAVSQARTEMFLFFFFVSILQDFFLFDIVYKQSEGLRLSLSLSIINSKKKKNNKGYWTVLGFWVLKNTARQKGVYYCLTMYQILPFPPSYLVWVRLVCLKFCVFWILHEYLSTSDGCCRVIVIVDHGRSFWKVLHLYESLNGIDENKECWLYDYKSTTAQWFYSMAVASEMVYLYGIMNGYLPLRSDFTTEHRPGCLWGCDSIPCRPVYHICSISLVRCPHLDFRYLVIQGLKLHIYTKLLSTEDSWNAHIQFTCLNKTIQETTFKNVNF